MEKEGWVGKNSKEIVAIDSHALFWFVSGDAKLSPDAYDAIVSAKKVIVPIIVVLEVISILEKYNALVRLPDLFGALYKKRFFIYPLDRRVLRKYLLITQTLEIHDRIIVATAQLFNAPLITKDKEIKGVYPNTIW